MPTTFRADQRPICPVCNLETIAAKGSRKCRKCRYTPGWFTEPIPAETITASGDTAHLTREVETPVRSLDALIKACDIDTTEWEVERYVCNKWEQHSVDKGKVSLWQVKAWLKRRRNIIDARDEIEAMKRQAKKAMPALPAVKRPRLTGNMLEIALVDHHFGKLAWDKETGEDYDLGIAVRLYEKAIDELVSRTGHNGFDRVTLVIGNDMLHMDNRKAQTTGGTQMDSDSRYQKVFRVARELKTRTILRLRQEVAPVTVIAVPGNHDTDSTFHMGDSLECFFANVKDVEVDNHPTTRKYLRHGAVMLMFMHGDKGRRADYPLLMATEQPEMFGSTRFREIHTGHYHQTRVEEKHGVRTRILSALTGEDAWHSEMTFTGNIRCSEAFVWNRHEGLVATAFTNATGGDARKR